MTKLDRCLNYLAIMAFIAVISWGFAKLEYLGYSRAEQEYRRAAIDAGVAEMQTTNDGKCVFVWTAKNPTKAKNVEQPGEVR